MTQAFSSSLPQTLRDLLRTYAPDALLLASVEGQALRLSAQQTPEFISELAPPDEWFESGELIWLSRDGALLGLLWSALPVADTTQQMLTLLLSAAREDASRREADVLITQLPEGAAWLSEDLAFQQVSRRFLELHSLNAGQVLGRHFSEVFPERQETLELLSKAAAGRAATQQREVLITPGAAPTWVRSEMRPYFGGSAAGVLWTMQDISYEVSLGSRVAALLRGARLPTAVLDPSGHVLECSDSLRTLWNEHDLQGLIWQWPIWEHAAQAQEELLLALSEARTQPSRRVTRVLHSKSGHEVQLQLHVGEVLGAQPGAPLLVAEFRVEQQMEQESEHVGLLASVIAHSPQPTLLLGRSDESGERGLWLASNAAADLLGLNRNVISEQRGRKLSTLLQAQNVQFSRSDGTPLSPISLITQATVLLAGSDTNKAAGISAVLTRPDGSKRHLNILAAHLSLASASGAQTATPSDLLPGDQPLALYLHDVTAVRHLENRLKHDAGHDPLTGLPNWAGLRERLSAPSHTTLMALAIDGFSVLQAALGRASGDHLLIQLAAKLHQWRKDAQVARLEGETFALALPLLDAADALKLAREVQGVIGAPMRASGREVRLSASVGVALGNAGSAEELLERSRTALLAAQRTGRAGQQVYDPELQNKEATLLELESDLRGAGTSQFTLLYQPIISLESGRVQGAEALLRWQHPQRGLLAPGLFLPLAERSDQMQQLGLWVVEQVSAQRKQWQVTHPNFRINFNLSASELLNAAFLSHLAQEVKTVGGLDLEVTASSLLGEGAKPSDAQTMTALRELGDAGAKVFVDDFGDGASSLTALERFALSGVKLHPSFVANLLSGPRPLALVEGTVELARRLNLQVVAVGVETQAQASALHAAGCSAAQGYFYAPPMALSALEDWLAGQVLD